MSNISNSNTDRNKNDDARNAVEKALASGRVPTLVRFCLATLGGIFPVFGGAFGAGAGAWSEHEQNTFNRLFAAWLKLQEDEIQEIGRTLAEVMIRIDYTDPRVEKRIQSPEYLSLIRKSFRDWSAAESEDKRQYVRNLLSNAAAPEQICSDDIIRLFIKWIDDYSEAHFQVIKAIYNKSGSTRGQMWMEIHGASVREDAPEADLFKLLIRNLSTGGIIRQHRPKDEYGNFIRQQTRRKRGSRHTSAFDDEKPYELTELGKWFVHYTMNEIVPRITHTTDDKQSN